MPAPSWPKITGNSPSGSAPERVNSSVWQMPVALISIKTSPARGPARSTVTISSGLPAAYAMAALVFMNDGSRSLLLAGPVDLAARSLYLPYPAGVNILGAGADSGPDDRRNYPKSTLGERR